MKLPRRVTVCEVGTREGFQIEPDFIPTAQKMEVETGIDLDALIGVSKRVQEIIGHSLPGQIVKAGKWTRRYPLPDGVQSRLAPR